MKLKPKDIKPLREQLLIEQGGLCAICHEHIDPGQAVLDHDHRSGYVRAVLHRGCNAFIGALENNQKRNLITLSRLDAIMANFTRYVVTTTEIIHPSHLTAEERTERTRRRAKKRRQQAKRSNQKL